MIDTDEERALISRYVSVANELPNEALDIRILEIAASGAEEKRRARAWYASAAAIAVGVLGIGLYLLQPQSEPAIPVGATETFGLVEGSTRAFLMRQVSTGAMGPGDSFFVRVVSATEED
jgi:hypothetical protein